MNTIFILVVMNILGFRHWRRRAPRRLSMDKYVGKNLSYFEDLERAKNLHKGRRAPVRCDRYQNDKFLSCAPSRSFDSITWFKCYLRTGKEGVSQNLLHLPEFNIHKILL